MGVNFMEAKKGRRTGKMGKAAKKASTAPKGPPTDSVADSASSTRNQMTAIVATKKTRARIEPASTRRMRNQKKTERTTGHSEMRARVPVGRQTLKGSIQT